jgi:hypothetical protein
MSDANMEKHEQRRVKLENNVQNFSRLSHGEHPLMKMNQKEQNAHDPGKHVLPGGH